VNTTKFWSQTGERAVKTFCQVLAATLLADQVGVLEADWASAASLAAGAALLSLLTSIASEPFGAEDSPSLVE
jgi:hypothetical protein